MTSVLDKIGGMTDFVTVDFDYDANSNRTSMSASLIVDQMPVKDYKNTYSWRVG